MQKEINSIQLPRSLDLNNIQNKDITQNKEEIKPKTEPAPPKELDGKSNAQCYEEYCKLYFTNIVLTNQLKALLGEKNELLNKIKKYEVRHSPEHSQARSHHYIHRPMVRGKKEGRTLTQRHRRAAMEINRHYRCPIESCSKSYGSEGSLNQHMKLKHPEIYNGGVNEIKKVDPVLQDGVVPTKY